MKTIKNKVNSRREKQFILVDLKNCTACFVFNYLYTIWG